MPMMALRRRHCLALAAGLPFGLSMAADPPVRLISIGGALTELVYELGLQPLLVGVDSTSLYPAAAQQLPQVGYARTLATEGLLSLRPSLIVATEDAGPPAVLRQLEAARVPLHVLRAEHRFEGLIARCLRLGELLQRPAEAQALAQRLTQQWQTSLAQVQQLQRRDKTPPRVLFILSHGLNQIRIAGQETAAEAMIRYAGGANAVQGFSGYKQLTPEAAIAAAPDIILVTDQGLAAAGNAGELLKLPGLAHTPAGRAKRVLSLEALELLGFGPRLPQALARLAQGLHAQA
jgi:iron complex transport system substrate-binding protein